MKFRYYVKSTAYKVKSNSEDINSNLHIVKTVHEMSIKIAHALIQIHKS